MTDSTTPLRLSADGKPMRALRVLRDHRGVPLTEREVWLASRHDEYDTTPYYAALRTLMNRGLAQRTGRAGGIRGYRWHITRAGLDALAQLDKETPGANDA